MPASLGVQGPGESTMASGGEARTSSAVSASLRTTSTEVASGPSRCTRFQVKLS
jgi:hypothetical protein